MSDVCTIREATARAKNEGMHISEHAIRHWVKTGAIPSRKIGVKSLIFYPNLLRYLQCEDFNSELAPTPEIPGIHPVIIRG